MLRDSYLKPIKMIFQCFNVNNGFVVIATINWIMKLGSLVHKEQFL